MALVLILVFLVAPLMELAVIVRVAGAIGVLDTVGLLVLVSVLGGLLAKREGLGVLRRIRATLGRGQVPTAELLDGGLVLLAGALMIAPGFVSDVLALVLLFPVTRAAVRASIQRSVTRRGRLVVLDRPGSPRTTGARRGGDSPADVWDAESWEDPPGPRSPRQLRDGS